MSTAKAACTRKSSRVAIVGGGLAGMVAADALASRGFEDLHVFDMGETEVYFLVSLSLSLSLKIRIPFTPLTPPAVVLA